jgi:hypothetical protein
MKNFILYSIIVVLSIFSFYSHNDCNLLERRIEYHMKDNEFLQHQNSQLKIELLGLR